MVFGTYDILHPGHAYFLKQAKKFGDFLIVVVSRDNTARSLKRRKPLFSERQRLRHVKNLYFVNRVVLGNLVDKYAVIEKYKPSVICLGYDQTHFTQQLERELKERHLTTKIIRLKPYKQYMYKSSIMRQGVEKARRFA